jgi:hypothetical protein
MEWKTPTPNSVRSYATNLMFDMASGSASHLRGMEKLLKGITQLSEVHKILKQDLSRTEQAQLARKVRADRPRKKVIGGSVISVEEAQKKKRVKEQELKATAAKKRLKDERKSIKKAEMSIE